MKTLTIYTIYDSKAEVYGQPFLQLNQACCERSIRSMLSGNDHYSKAPEDFTCYEIGSYDESTGTITAHDTPKAIYQFIQFTGGASDE